VRRILTLIIMLVIAVAPASMISAAVCHHHSAVEHALARSSADPRIANTARTEETAAALSKKGIISDTASGFLLADMLPAPELKTPFHASEPLDRFLPSESALPSASIPPLLQPPTA
jgi:hypothetical protein